MNNEFNEEIELKSPDFTQEIIEIISTANTLDIPNLLYDYHDYDIARAIPLLSKEQRLLLYKCLGDERVSDLFTHLENPAEFIEELSNEHVADILEEMDADDAVDILEDLDEEKQKEVIELLDDEIAREVELICTYSDELIGSRMTNDFVCVQSTLSVKQAMRSVIAQAGEKDNISTIFVTDDDGVYLGAIRLRDLVIARADTPLDEVIIKSFPFLYASAQIDESLWELKEYAEPSLPILNDDNRLIGALTSADTIEALDEELTDDYARLAGLTEEDLEEALEKRQIFSGALKRLPWLVVLLILDLFIGMYIGIFEAVVIGLPFLVSFQQLVSGMSGNTGTQTLASAINLLSDNADDGKKQRKFLFNELKIGLCIGLITGFISFVAVSLYAYFTGATEALSTDFNTGFAVGIAMMLSTTVASVTGALIPITLNKLKVDPAVASGPLITTLNDLIAITVYYGFALLLLL